MIDRNGRRIRYVIDFYAGKRSSLVGPDLAFFLDVRPALDSFEALRMRVSRTFERLLTTPRQPASA